MFRNKKCQKSSDSESESSDESSSSSSNSAEEDYRQQQKCVKKKRKQKDKKKKHKKVKSAKKKSKRNYKSDDNSSDNSETSAESVSCSEDKKSTAKKKLVKEEDKSSVRLKREKSRSRERQKQILESKWESPPRRARSRSRERYKSDRSRSRDRYRDDRSRSRNRDRSQERYHDRTSERYKRVHRNYRTDMKRELEDNRRDYKSRNDRKQRSPRRERDRSRERDRHRNYIKDEPRSPNTSKSFGNRYGNTRKEEDGITEWGKPSGDKKLLDNEVETKEKEKPNFALSGALTEDANKVNGVVVKYAEPPEARKPKRRWRLYPFKGETALPVLHIHRQSCFLVGRDRKVVDLAVDHPSCSKQHAALQYRLVSFERENGTQGKRVRLYLIDLDSANGTFLNNKRIDARKYYELMEKDVIKFGFSTREYVLLHENSKEDQEDDDIEVKEEAVDD